MAGRKRVSRCARALGALGLGLLVALTLTPATSGTASASGACFGTGTGTSLVRQPPGGLDEWNNTTGGWTLLPPCRPTPTDGA